MAAQEVVGIDVGLETDFVRAVKWAMWLAERITASKGFHDSPPTDAECVALVHSEASEILEALRHGNPPDDKIGDRRGGGFSGAEAEAADVVIRLFSWYQRRKWRLAEAIMAKMRFNQTREYMHGGKEF